MATNVNEPGDAIRRVPLIERGGREREAIIKKYVGTVVFRDGDSEVHVTLERLDQVVAECKRTFGEEGTERLVVREGQPETPEQALDVGQGLSVDTGVTDG